LLIVKILLKMLKNRRKTRVGRSSKSQTSVTEKETRVRRSSRELVDIEKPVKFDLTKEKKAILNILENSTNNVFLTGKAGTGKSAFLKHFRITTKKNVVVLAFTGVAAVNVQGQTIHSFLNSPPNNNR